MLRVRLLHPDAVAPRRASDGAAGYDLCVTKAIAIESGGWTLAPTGVAIATPPGTYGRIAPRSGLAVRHGLGVGAGVVDSDYTGEVGVVLMNHGDKPVQLNKGDRVAQLVLERIATPDVELTDGELESTERGGGGFGSTGV